MSDGSGGAPRLDEQAVEAAAREAFWTDDLGGHIKGKHTWDSIPDEGRENYRTMIRAAVRAYLAASPRAGELETGPQPGVMHPVDEAFYKLAVKERDYERRKVDRLTEELAKLHARLDRKDDEA